jgi:DNA-directed RNA polymerase specialized sigma24 family protein
MNHDKTPTDQGKWFESTRWSLILKAQTGDDHASISALGDLCTTYRKPLIRAAMWDFQLSEPDAEEIVQGFQAWMVEKDFIRKVDHSRGRFRSFILLALKRYWLNDLEKRNASKRGGKLPHVPLEATETDPTANLGPDIAEKIDYEWAKATLRAALAHLQASYAKRGSLEKFNQLKQAALGTTSILLDPNAAPPPPAAAAAANPQFSVDLHRFRKRLHEAFLLQVRDTVFNPEEEVAESSHLIRLLQKVG